MGNRVGALWSKKDKNGNLYQVGEVVLEGKKFEILIFQNSRKSSGKSPDFHVFEGARVIET